LGQRPTVSSFEHLKSRRATIESENAGFA